MGNIPHQWENSCLWLPRRQHFLYCFSRQKASILDYRKKTYIKFFRKILNIQFLKTQNFNTLTYLNTTKT